MAVMSCSGPARPGTLLAAHLAGLGMAVRAVSRHRPAELAGGTDWRAADVTGPPSGRRYGQGRIGGLPMCQCAVHAVAGALPAVAAGVLATAERTGLLLVVLENLYGYDRPGASR